MAGRVRGAGRRGLAHESVGHGNFSTLLVGVAKRKSFSFCASPEFSMKCVITLYVGALFAMLCIAAFQMTQDLHSRGQAFLAVP